VDIDEALDDPTVVAVLARWWEARLHEAPPFSGGVLDAWPALMVDGLAVCRAEERAIDAFTDWKERASADGRP
jgi:hypothetical protein